MPELPEVEIARRHLVHWLDGRRVVKADADDTRIFRGARWKDFASLRGRLLSLERRGKYLLFSFEEDRGLLAHLGMSGRFVRRPPDTPVPYSRARLHLDSEEVVHFADARMLGRMETCPASCLRSLAPIQALGFDPLADGLDVARLRDAVGGSKQELKVALMDQGRVAGLGNIHAAEALFRAGLHPSRPPASLTDAEWKRLARGVRAALDFGLREQQAEEEVRYLKEGGRNGFLVYGRAGTPCVRCGTTVESVTQGGRTTHFCPSCQPSGRVPESRAERGARTARRR
ncbi:formamidopyrimidine-DNA glycosylase [Cystobacter fuscus]|uniref:Formamidopyrimidine-DNA glycosylase n=1 Tax=Cystobacter fuscus TaxID=43 RepID=A0A250JFV1_9BACT|nr:bifunctional DNA-formamidopyrimidine glycosylase/DNA-(apurinic or apyrimidinic site) lyase [Cystobacter fuscus]ATB42779.1 formamidopyrimidine-DNA glycosylase [Cystobacter fuscus]